MTLGFCSAMANCVGRRKEVGPGVGGQAWQSSERGQQAPGLLALLFPRRVTHSNFVGVVFFVFIGII